MIKLFSADDKTISIFTIHIARNRYVIMFSTIAACFGKEILYKCFSLYSTSANEKIDETRGNDTHEYTIFSYILRTYRWGNTRINRMWNRTWNTFRTRFMHYAVLGGFAIRSTNACPLAPSSALSAPSACSWPRSQPRRAPSQKCRVASRRVLTSGMRLKRTVVKKKNMNVSHLGFECAHPLVLSRGSRCHINLIQVECKDGAHTKTPKLFCPRNNAAADNKVDFCFSLSLSRRENV